MEDAFNNTFTSFYKKSKDNYKIKDSVDKNDILLDIYKDFDSFLDSEINDLTSIEFLLKRIKSIDDIKIPLSGGKEEEITRRNNKTLSNISNNSTNETIKKKYQMNSVTIDLINTGFSQVPSMIGNDRSKSKK